MKEFLEKWKTDSKFKAKMQLGLYGIFVAFVAILAFSTNPNTTIENEYLEKNDKASIKIPEEYNYIVNLKINEDEYKFEINKEKEKETIKIINNKEESNYIYQDNNYYKNDSGIYVITTKEKVYAPLKTSYIEIDNINQYLSKAKKEDNKYIVYLKDIILGNNSEEYITISFEDDDLNNPKKINIDYTMLMKVFDDNTEKCIVDIEIE